MATTTDTANTLRQWLKDLWIAAGGSAQAADTAVAVALAESGGDPNASNSGGDTGLWQINKIWHPGLATFDPAKNAQAAVSLSGGGSNWRPWCTAWGDGACGTKGGDPPPPGGVAPDSPAARFLTPGAGTAQGVPIPYALDPNAAKEGADKNKPASKSFVQGLLGIAETAAGGLLMLAGLLLLARMAAAPVIASGLPTAQQTWGTLRGRSSGGGGSDDGDGAPPDELAERRAALRAARQDLAERRHALAEHRHAVAESRAGVE